MHQPSAGALVRSDRRELSWLEDDKLASLEYHAPPKALFLGMLSGGGGYLFNGDLQKAMGGFGAMLGALILTGVLPSALAILPLALVMSGGGIGAWQQARAINRFLRSRKDVQVAQSGTPASQQLLASMHNSTAPRLPANVPAAIQPSAKGEFQELLARLQNLAAIRASGVIDANEHRARKVDILEQVASGIGAEETESLLFALLPLLDANALTEEDLQFVKELGT